MTLPEKIYFHECGVSEEAVASVNVDHDNPFAGLAEDEEDTVKALATNLIFLRTNYSDQIDTDPAKYIDFDRELLTNQSNLTDKHIIHKVLRNSTDVSSDEDDKEVSEVESITKLLIEEVRRV